MRESTSRRPVAASALAGRRAAELSASDQRVSANARSSFAERPRDRLAVAERPDREALECARVVRDGLVRKAVDQFPADARVDGRDEAEPETRKPRRQCRHPDKQTLQAALSRVLVHQFAVRGDVGAADLEDLTTARVEVAGCEEVGDHVLDRDRLCPGLHPARRDHDRQPLGQSPDHLEGEASGADDDRRAELDRLDAGFAQETADFLPAFEMAGEVAPGAEPAEVDDPLHSGFARRFSEDRRRPAVELGEVGVGAHRVDEVVRDVDALERPRDRLGVEHITSDDFEPRLRRDRVGPAREAAHALSFLEEGAKETASDVAGRAGEKDPRSHWRPRPRRPRGRR